MLRRHRLCSPWSPSALSSSWWQRALRRETSGRRRGLYDSNRHRGSGKKHINHNDDRKAQHIGRARRPLYQRNKRREDHCESLPAAEAAAALSEVPSGAVLRIKREHGSSNSGLGHSIMDDIKADFFQKEGKSGEQALVEALERITRYQRSAKDQKEKKHVRSQSQERRHSRDCRQAPRRGVVLTSSLLASTGSVKSLAEAAVGEEGDGEEGEDSEGTAGHTSYQFSPFSSSLRPTMKRSEWRQARAQALALQYVSHRASCVRQSVFVKYQEKIAAALLGANEGHKNESSGGDDQWRRYELATAHAIDFSLWRRGAAAYISLLIQHDVDPSNGAEWRRLCELLTYSAHTHANVASRHGRNALKGHKKKAHVLSVPLCPSAQPASGQALSTGGSASLLKQPQLPSYLSSLTSWKMSWACLEWAQRYSQAGSSQQQNTAAAAVVMKVPQVSPLDLQYVFARYAQAEGSRGDSTALLESESGTSTRAGAAVRMAAWVETQGAAEASDARTVVWSADGASEDAYGEMLLKGNWQQVLRQAIAEAASRCGFNGAVAATDFHRGTSAAEAAAVALRGSDAIDEILTSSSAMIHLYGNTRSAFSAECESTRHACSAVIRVRLKTPAKSVKLAEEGATATLSQRALPKWLADAPLSAEEEALLVMQPAASVGLDMLALLKEKKKLPSRSTSVTALPPLLSPSTPPQAHHVLRAVAAQEVEEGRDPLVVSSLAIQLRKRLRLLASLPAHLPKRLVTFGAEGGRRLGDSWNRKGESTGSSSSGNTQQLHPCLLRCPAREALPWILLGCLGGVLEDAACPHVDLAGVVEGGEDPCHVNSRRGSIGNGACKALAKLVEVVNVVSPTLFSLDGSYAAAHDYACELLVQLGSLLASEVVARRHREEATSVLETSASAVDAAYQAAITAMLKPPSYHAFYDQQVVVVPPCAATPSRTHRAAANEDQQSAQPSNEGSPVDEKEISKASCSLAIQARSIWAGLLLAAEGTHYQGPAGEGNLKESAKAVLVKEARQDVLPVQPLEVLGMREASQQRDPLGTAIISQALSALTSPSSPSHPAAAPPLLLMRFLADKANSLRNYHFSLYLEALARSQCALVELLGSIAEETALYGPPVLAPESVVSVLTCIILQTQGNVGKQGVCEALLRKENCNVLYFAVSADKAAAASSYLKGMYHSSFVVSVDDHDGCSSGPHTPQAQAEVQKGQEARGENRQWHVPIDGWDGATALLVGRSLRVISRHPTTTTERFFKTWIDNAGRGHCAYTVPPLRVHFMAVDVVKAVQFFSSINRNNSSSSSNDNNNKHTENDRNCNLPGIAKEVEQQQQQQAHVVARGLPYGMTAVYKPAGMNCTLHAGYSSLVHFLSHHLPWGSQQQQQQQQREQAGAAEAEAEEGERLANTRVPSHHQQGLINRIDVGTSGLVLVGDTPGTLHTGKSAALVLNRVRKRYRALVQHVSPIKLQLSASPPSSLSDFLRCVSEETWFLPSRGGSITGRVLAGGGGLISHGYLKQDTTTTPATALRHYGSLDRRSALTHFTVLEYFPRYEVYYVEVELQSGRRHQIRQHFAGIYHPLVGDTRYHPTAAAAAAAGKQKSSQARSRKHATARPEEWLVSNREMEDDVEAGDSCCEDAVAACSFGLQRPALHAYALDITGDGCSKDDQRVVVECGLPQDMKKALEFLRQRR